MKWSEALALLENAGLTEVAASQDVIYFYVRKDIRNNPRWAELSKFGLHYDEEYEVFQIYV